MKLAHIRVLLTTTEFSAKATVFEAKETPKCFMFADKRLSKDKIMKIDSGYIRDNMHSFIYQETYCFEADIDLAVNQCMQLCTNKAIRYYEDIKKVMNSIGNKVETKIKSD